MITQTIQKQITDAMKAKDSLRLSTLKMLSSELHNEWIAKQHELSHDEEIAVVRKEVKKRKDAIEAYEKAGRFDRVEAEKNELTILQEFLPTEISDEELDKIVNDSINQTGATSMQDMGKVMGIAMQKVVGKASGDRVSAMVKQKLSS